MVRSQSQGVKKDEANDNLPAAVAAAAAAATSAAARGCLLGGPEVNLEGPARPPPSLPPLPPPLTLPRYVRQLAAPASHLCPSVRPSRSTAASSIEQRKNGTRATHARKPCVRATHSAIHSTASHAVCQAAQTNASKSANEIVERQPLRGEQEWGAGGEGQAYPSKLRSLAARNDPCTGAASQCCETRLPLPNLRRTHSALPSLHLRNCRQERRDRLEYHRLERSNDRSIDRCDTER